MGSTINLGEVGAITQKYFVPKLVDNIFTSNPLLQRAKRKWMDTIDGGAQLVVPVAYAQTTAAGWYAGAGALDTTANDQIDALTFDWAQAYANITITRSDELKNSGRSQIINLVKAKVQLAEKTLADKLGTALYTGTAANLQPVGLETAIATASTYGGISQTTYTWLAAQIDSTTTVLSVPMVRKLIGSCTVGSDRPTVATTTQTYWNSLYNLVQPQQRFVDEETANAGFTNILWEGMPVLVDSHVGSTNLFTLLNEDYVHLVVHKDENFRFEPFVKPVNQNVSSAKIYLMCVLYVDNPRMCGAFTALT
jgi:HK97 family phage major capsid protein